MARYIDADELKKVLDDGYTKHFLSSAELVYVDQMIDNAPTADVVEVVRCEDCRYWENRFDVMVCNLTDGMKGASDYCSYGERREDGEIH